MAFSVLPSIWLLISVITWEKARFGQVRCLSNNCYNKHVFSYTIFTYPCFIKFAYDLLSPGICRRIIISLFRRFGISILNFFRVWSSFDCGGPSRLTILTITSLVIVYWIFAVVCNDPNDRRLSSKQPLDNICFFPIVIFFWSQTTSTKVGASRAGESYKIGEAWTT